MNPINELKLSIQHLSNYAGSSVPTGQSKKLAFCCLGCLKFLWSLSPKAVSDVNPIELEEINSLFEFSDYDFHDNNSQ